LKRRLLEMLGVPRPEALAMGTALKGKAFPWEHLLG
jgi:hypothetical protein